MRETFASGGVVINRLRQVLVVNQHGNSWSLPKGHIDEGEESLMAAKREIYEESGITEVEYVKDLGSYQRFRIGDSGIGEDRTEFKNIKMFLFKTEQMDLKPIDPQNPEARWVDKEKVGDLLTHEKDKEFFRKVLLSEFYFR